HTIGVLLLVPPILARHHLVFRRLGTSRIPLSPLHMVRRRDRVHALRMFRRQRAPLLPRQVRARPPIVWRRGRSMCAGDQTGVGWVAWVERGAHQNTSSAASSRATTSGAMSSSMMPPFAVRVNVTTVRCPSNFDALSATAKSI